MPNSHFPKIPEEIEPPTKSLAQIYKEKNFLIKSGCPLLNEYERSLIIFVFRSF